jgi:putative transposase
MREMDFSEKNLRNRWLGVNSIWHLIQGEVKQYVKSTLERVMRQEVSACVSCGRYERSTTRRGYRNGTYTRDLLSSYGWLEGLAVPRVRSGGFQPSVFAKYRRRQRQVDLVLLEAFLLGHATRKTRRLCQRVFGAEISAQGVSNIVRGLDREVQEFHRRPLSSAYRFVYLDGLWVTLSKPVKVKKVLLVALGVKVDGTKELLGFQLVPRESESCWWGFLSDLRDRGLGRADLEVLVTDGAPGLLRAVTALYPRVKRQRCTFHKTRDLGQHLAERKHRWRIVADAARVFEGGNDTEVRRRLQAFRSRWSVTEPKAVRNFLRGFDECLTYLEYPEPTRTMLKTSNPIERYLEEFRRRIIPMRSFNNAKSVERIIYGIIAYVLNQEADTPKIKFTQST